ncbi:hypothetical protein [Cellulomonas sp. PhB143]|uniref:hypothetical protein n=1 Tax=Cellulomonas sp. PhB143 TaxID=2485186 RepID=UPI000F9C3288|nr:hypothetical protein [Cellulomonas sp. PhB143]ROS73691.1 hypothetical protein EDF32_2547 [Cellulomonas sp. PhB143]
MSIFRRTTRLPDDVRRGLDLPAGDRVLAAAELLDDAWAVATFRAVHVTTEPPLSRPWTAVDRAAFDPITSEITVEWVDDDPPLVLALADADRTAFPQMLRERVQASVVIAETLAFTAERQARVSVRRDHDGTLFSQVSVDPGVDLHDPRVSRRIDEAEANVRSASGLPL